MLKVLIECNMKIWYSPATINDVNVFFIFTMKGLRYFKEELTPAKSKAVWKTMQQVSKKYHASNHEKRGDNWMIGKRVKI